MPYLRRCDVQRRHSEERLPLANRSHPFLRSHYLHVLLLDGTSRCRGRERYVSRRSSSETRSTFHLADPHFLSHLQELGRTSPTLRQSARG